MVVRREVSRHHDLWAVRRGGRKQGGETCSWSGARTWEHGIFNFIALRSPSMCYRSVNSTACLLMVDDACLSHVWMPALWLNRCAAPATVDLCCQ